MNRLQYQIQTGEHIACKSTSGNASTDWTDLNSSDFIDSTSGTALSADLAFVDIAVYNPGSSTAYLKLRARDGAGDSTTNEIFVLAGGAIDLQCAGQGLRLLHLLLHAVSHPHDVFEWRVFFHPFLAPFLASGEPLQSVFLHDRRFSIRIFWRQRRLALAQLGLGRPGVVDRVGAGVVEMRRDLPDLVGQHVARGPCRTTGDDTRTRSRGLHQHATGTGLTEDGVDNRRTSERHLEEVLARFFDALLHRESRFFGLAVSETDAALAVADHHQSGEAKATTTHDDLAHAVHLDGALFVSFKLLVVH